MERYRNYSDYLKERYGEKVYKIPVSLPVTCPNRDGCLSSGGCIFCGSIGADYETKAVGMGITRQLDRSMAHVGPKYKARKFIAYFLNFTNTYAPLSDFKSWVEEAMSHPAVVAVDVSTRPDCIHEAYLDVLKEASLRYGKDVTVELGLQSSNVHTLSVLNRCHGLAEFIDAALRIGRYGFDLCTHVIADLPWDDRLDVAETAKIISALPVTEVKLHSLYIVKGTKLADMYEKGEVSLLPMEEYMERAVLFSFLSPEGYRGAAHGRPGVGWKYDYCERRLSLVGSEGPHRPASGGKKYYPGLPLPLSGRQGSEAVFEVTGFMKGK